jgi:hypothetical protein
MANKKKSIGKQIRRVKEAVDENVDDPALAETMAKDFEELLLNLNNSVESRIEQFRSSSVRILRDTYQTRPFQIFNVINEMIEKIYATTMPVGGCLNTVIDNCFRREVADCLKDLIDIYQRGVAEKYLKHSEHLGAKAN